MATITPTTATNLIADMWAAEFVNVLRNAPPVTSAITVDSEVVGAWTEGDKLKIGVPGSIAVATKTPGSAYAVVANTPTAAKTLTLNQHKHVTFSIDDVTALFAKPGLKNFWIEDSALALAEDLNSYIMGLYASFTTNVVGTGTLAGLTIADIAQAMAKLDLLKVPSAGRTLFLHPTDKYELLSDPAAVNYFQIGNTAPIATGKLPPLFGFNIMDCPQVVTATSRRNLALHKRAMIFGTRPLEIPDPNTGVTAVIRRDPLSGFIFRVLTSYQATMGSMQVTVETLYGVSVLDETRGVLCNG
jgi:hypothetical protein